jgi:hypothetical protein
LYPELWQKFCEEVRSLLPNSTPHYPEEEAFSSTNWRQLFLYDFWPIYDLIQTLELSLLKRSYVRELISSGFDNVVLDPSAISITEGFLPFFLLTHRQPAPWMIMKHRLRLTGQRTRKPTGEESPTQKYRVITTRCHS